MPRFTAQIDGSDFVVKDTAQSPVLTILSMPVANLHSDGGGSTLTPTMTIAEVDLAFSTPYGTEREMGFDLIFDFHNTHDSPKEIGGFGFDASGFDLGGVKDLLKPMGDGFTVLGNGGENYRIYPGDMYSPVILFRNDEDGLYNFCMTLLYPVLKYDHQIQTRARVDAEFRFRARGDNNIFSSTGWFTMAPGEKRRYTLCVRINDRTDTNIGPAPDAAQEWLWTLRGYQQYFRRLYGKPDYRRMGGWDGRVMASFNASTAQPYSGGNPRRFETSPLRNPSTDGTGGEPDGYYKFAEASTDYLPKNVTRILIWALSGYDTVLSPPEPQEGDYDPRFATGVETLDIVGDGVGPTTIRAAMRETRDAMQLGLYWGRACRVPDSDVWSELDRHDFDPSSGSDVNRMRRELDLAVKVWKAQAIGLDAYALGLSTPGQGVAWLRDMQAHYPHTLFITEEALPDVLHVFAPTYVIDSDAETGTVLSPFWLVNYINPGSEYIVQSNVASGQAARALQLASDGFTAISGWGPSIEAGLRAAPRWIELGEFPIPGYTSPFASRPLNERPHSLA